MNQLSLGDLWSDACASCSCGGALLVHDQRHKEPDLAGLPVTVVVRVTRCLRCASEQRVEINPVETPAARIERLRSEVAA
jgi:hypothetical protein